MLNDDLKSKFIEKIKKLLELATSDNENEAKLAMESAQKLMLKYSIEHSELNQANNAESILVSEYWNNAFGKPGLLNVVPDMIGTIGPIFGVYGLVGMKSVHGIKGINRVDLIGFPTNVEIVRFAMDSIIQQGLAEAKIEYRKYRTTTFGDSFWKGFAAGLYSKFGNYSKDEAGLVVYDDVKQFANSKATGTYRSQDDNGLAQSSGYAAGQRVELRRGIESNNTGKLLK